MFQHSAPDYSCAYVIVKTDSNLEGRGMTFTVGKGTHIGKMSYKRKKSISTRLQVYLWVTGGSGKSFMFHIHFCNFYKQYLILKTFLDIF